MTQATLLRRASGSGSRTALALAASVLLASTGGAAAGTATAPKATLGTGQILFTSTFSGVGTPRIELVDVLVARR